MTKSTILIVGANGKTGSRVNALLNAKGVATRPVSRSTTPAFDWNDQGTWDAALQGTQAAYVTYQPDLAVPQAEATIRAFVARAKALGLKHLVLLSGRGEDGAQCAERVLMESGLTWNLVRASWFFQNFSESFMAEGIVSGELALPADAVKEPFVDADDIAEVAVAALTRRELHNRLFEVTGPEAMTFAESVAEISRQTGQTIRYRYMPVDDYIARLDAEGVPEDYQWLLRELFTVVLDGRNSQTMNGVEEALGRPATNFSTYVSRTIDAGHWQFEPVAKSA